MNNNPILFNTSASLLVISLAIVITLARYFSKIRQRCCKKNTTSIAFFHPHCSAGGGGERVLWKAIEALSQLNTQGLNAEVVVYTSDCFSESYHNDVLKKVQGRFSIQIPTSLPLKFIHIPKKQDPSSFKRLTLIAESLDTIKLAWFALNMFTPHVFIDTTGCAFTFLVAKLARCKIVAYVHYPTVSTDMLNLVWERRPTYNNTSNVTKSSLATYIKLIYYSIFAIAYGCLGSLCDLVMVNSTWTYGHVSYMWRFARKRMHIVYPPCDTDSLRALSIENREPLVLSIGQFRPEKDHTLQIKAFARMLKLAREKRKVCDAKLILVGSCRGKGDQERVEKLRVLTQSLGISDSVEFVLNQPFPVLKEYFSRASVGLHTMWNEHFGIGVVEMMAAGLITIAHNSGGPKADIVVPIEEGGGKGVRNRTGFLASSEEEYANAMFEALQGLSDKESRSIRSYAQDSSKRFSDDVFNTSFKNLFLKLLNV